ncbi:MucR family transcriptional regulator [Sulfitobacter sp. 15WGC]|uniref:MucR family transcriptional regulator n=1 Tax=Sulfitobacter sp. 15WGC TaxID=2575437 RepID=UPI0010AC32B0|nr:MucR family transcriptional regulator [Sulfitobacter sp. 15WGC]TKA84387.1 GAF domain-containing protein [Sulfitobacter sp. 15WGC]
MSVPLINKVNPEPIEDDLERSARVARRALSTPIAMISWFDPMEGVHQVGSTEEVIDLSGEERNFQMALKIAKRIVARKQPWAVSDARGNPILSQTSAVKEGGVMSCISVPIHNTQDGNILGAISCVSLSPRAWTEEDLQVLTHLGQLVDRQFASGTRKSIEASKTSQIKDKPASNRFWETANYEFRTPLKLISEASRVLNDLNLEGSSGALVGTIARSSTQLLAITDGLIRVYERDEGGASSQNEKSDLLRRIKSAALLHWTQAASKGITLTVKDRLETDFNPVVDRACLAEVVDHLVSNAVAANTEGAVSIELESDASSNLLIKVRDTGLGIALKHNIDLLTKGLTAQEGSFEETSISSLIPVQLRLASIGGSLKISGKLGVGSQYEIRLQATPHTNRTSLPSKPGSRSRLITCLECGEQMSLLRRHLMLEHNLTPEAYRKKWKLPDTFSLASPAYEFKRAATRRK